MGIIYVLCDPRPNVGCRQFYVGMTGCSPITRRAAHVNESRNPKRRNTPKRRWIGEIMDAGMVPGIVKLAYVPDDEPDQLSAMETFWIERYRQELGLQLVNVAPGGRGRHGPLSDTTRAKMSLARKGRKFSAEHRASMSAAQRGRKAPPRTPEWREAHAAKMRGRRHSADTKAKMSAAHRGSKKPALGAIAATRPRTARGTFLPAADVAKLAALL